VYEIPLSFHSTVLTLTFPVTPALGADEYLSSLKESLLASAKKRNTAGSQLLSLADVKRVVDYAMRFIFKQLPLYQYVFTVDQDSTEKTQ